MNNRREIRDELNVKNQEVPWGAPISCGRVPKPITLRQSTTSAVNTVRARRCYRNHINT